MGNVCWKDVPSYDEVNYKLFIWWSKLLGCRDLLRHDSSFQDDPRLGRSAESVIRENCRAVENIVPLVSSHTLGSCKFRHRHHLGKNDLAWTLGYVKDLCTMGRSNSWPENEVLPSSGKSAAREVKLGFVHAMDSTRRESYTPLWPWHQTRKHAVEVGATFKGPLCSRTQRTKTRPKLSRTRITLTREKTTSGGMQVATQCYRQLTSTTAKKW